jgi:putative two-component system response regulator
MSAVHTDMRLLVVDDNAANVKLLTAILAGAGYHDVASTSDPRGVLELCGSVHPDLVILDLHMPGCSGHDVLESLADYLDEPESLPVLVLTADTTADARYRALSLGARDFVTKPLDQNELLLRVRNLLLTRHLHVELRDRNAVLSETVRARTLELEQARLESLTVLAAAVEYRDADSYEHTQRVGRTASLIAAALELPEQTVTLLRDAAPLHDIGKVGVPDSVLLKPGPLTDEQFSLMKTHVDIGASILATARSPVLCTAAEIARTHHERWDGRGYLQGLSGSEIPLSGRITAVADVFDALTHERPYKLAWETDRALEEIEVQRGRQFDPRVVDAFRWLDHSALLSDAALNTVARLVA